MARTAAKTGRILSELYDETFANDSYEPFRITWADLRGIAGVTRLTPFYLRTINRMLNESGYSLIPFDTFLVVTQEADLSHFRLVPPRLVEQYRYEKQGMKAGESKPETQTKINRWGGSFLDADGGSNFNAD
jgi:hypothetical protein